jgi:acetyltransferase
MTTPPMTRQVEIDRWRSPTGRDVLIRSVGADDAALEVEFLRRLSPQTLYERMFSHRKLRPGELRGLVQFDVRREIALLAAAQGDEGEEVLAVARLKKQGAGPQCEFAIVVSDHAQHQGIGERLLRNLLAVARKAGIREVTGHTMATNTPMKALCRKLGFSAQPDPDDATLTLLSIAP